MLPIFYYLLKVIVCSGLLYSYYYFALRNKRFHQYNRFYLLFTLIASWLIPLVQFEFWNASQQNDDVAMKLITMVSTSDVYVFETIRSAGYTLTYEDGLLSILLMISLGFAVRLTVGFTRIAKLIKENPNEIWNNITIVFVNSPGAPFSFFRYIFWNRDIDMNTTEGKHILQHELTHINEKHSLDKLLINGMLILGWANPFIWLIRKELNMIHEFIADNKAINNGDAEAFAVMLLRSTYPQHDFALSNSFFHSPIKRRFIMLTTSKKPSYSYLRRLMILPIMALVFIFFAFKAKNNQANDPIALEHTYTVLVDAGHGGEDNGAMSETGIYEKELTLILAKAVQAYNQNKNIRIILTRKSDETLSPSDRIGIIEKNNPDLLISLHINKYISQDDSRSGAEIFLSKKNEEFVLQNTLLAGLLSSRLEKIFNKTPLIIQRQMGIRVIDQNKVCPSLFVELGYLSNSKDLSLLQSGDKQKLIAEALIKTIENYFYQTEKKIEGVKVLEPASGEVNIERQGDKNVTAETITVNKSVDVLSSLPANGSQTNLVDTPPVKASVTIKEVSSQIKITSSNGDTSTVTITRHIPQRKAMVTLNGGSLLTYAEFEKLAIDMATISSINVLKGDAATVLYGNKGKDGVLQIFTKANVVINEPVFSKVFTKVEQPPVFSRGATGLTEYFQENLRYPKNALEYKVEGAVTIQFIVDEEGNLSNFRKITNKGFGLEEEAIRLLQNAGKWIAGVQNGRKIPVQLSHTITFHLPAISSVQSDKSVTIAP